MDSDILIRPGKHDLPFYLDRQTPILCSSKSTRDLFSQVMHTSSIMRVKSGSHTSS